MTIAAFYLLSGVVGAAVECRVGDCGGDRDGDRGGDRGDRGGDVSFGEKFSFVLFAIVSVTLSRNVTGEPIWWLIVLYYASYVIFVYQQYRARLTSPDSRSVTKSD